MELFLLLSALICGITGTVRTAVVRAPTMVMMASGAVVAAEGQRAAAVRAYALAANNAVPPRPDGYVAPLVAAGMAPLTILAPTAPERRRE